MIKKNQFALIFLTIVTMLAVWYIKTPVDAKDPSDEQEVSGSVDENARLPQLVAMREAVRAERSIVASSLDIVLADDAASLSQKEIALQDKKDLSKLTEKEVLLELAVINCGFRDAFVHATTDGITILVVGGENSHTIANELITLALDSFGDEYDTVIVNFKALNEITNS